MQSEKKHCQNCKKEFIIEPEDFLFYEKMNVPPPTWCPECRLVRRLAFDNLKTLYTGSCDRCGKALITGFSPESPVKKYCNTCWWSDSWDGLDYGRAIDFSRPFFEQIKELMIDVPWMARAADEPTMENSDYTMNVGHLKNCYLVFHGDFDEDCSYCDTLNNSKDCFECSMADGCELCYDCVNIRTCYKTFHCVDCEHSNDIQFCRDCVGCSHCFGCVGLRNKEHCFFNEQLTKEDYTKRIVEYEGGSYRQKQAMIDRAGALWLKRPHRYMHGRQNEDVSGDYVEHSKNIHQSFQVSLCEDSKFIGLVGIKPVNDSYDYTSWGNGAARVCDCMAVGEGVDMMKFSYMCWPSCSDIEYSLYAISSSNCFGCVGLRKKQYCILNKQYTKEEYEALVPKIKEHMNAMPSVDSKGRIYRYGEFFPTEFSAYAYNESRAQEYFPLTRDEANTRGYRWYDRDVRDIVPTKQSDDLPDTIHDVPDTYIKEIIACAHAGECNDQCTKAFKVIAQELAFYRRMNVPLPRLCPNCRYAQRIRFRNPMKLWNRLCQCAGEKSTNGAYTNSMNHLHGSEPCQVSFQTSYDPQKVDIIYCEECYKAEVL